ncbi:ParB/RepB/Spo0J family partition protein [Spiroplasma citri]|uniref:ParB/RepB/Spo0J family partition protein n=2 Tax=Spiroplasma citri TaxID=2133 RepID=A0AAJ4JXU2_SPICI|nr:ParB/RepB/Spo0J family partition protein [Spiroplasma citri]APE74178.1 chromosome partitioning protein ParB [Spiroplasma citri]QED24150.1 ParB/RepB/Spo0J family partition protein [Spiroplasma citri]QIA66429.1 ParB/RepB/Spo0J family partition protein [Spiroplasma citri]QIA68306.1 ParB/RepB/Spo0J family partition protein [Spiroplasma citri]QIA70182.1 ParB/RepB/Spo0J family partition protein [Spiroplasma citri]
MASNTKSRLSSKGLDKIFGEGINEVIKGIESNDALKETANEIALAEIFPNPHQPRKNFNEEELTELAQSIKEYGLIQPIIVKKTNNGYYLVAGERRSRAAKLAGLTTIPAIVADFNDQQMKEVALIENIQRVDLNSIEEANAYKELIELLRLTQEELAQRIGKSRSHVTNTMRLLNLPTEVQTLLLENKVTMGQVKPLISLNVDKNEFKNIINKIINLNLNARQVEELVKEYNPKITKPLIEHSEKDSSKRAVNEFLENKIMRRLGTKVVIDTDKILIKYTGIKDLNRILELLGLIDD